MNNRVIHILTFAALLILFSIQLLNADVFSKRVTSTLNHRIMPDLENTLDIENTFTYTETEPPLIQTITSTTTQTTPYGPVISTVVSTFENSYSVSENLTTVQYYEYRDNFQGLYAFYRFVFNENDDLLETQYTNYSNFDMVYGQYRYRNVHQPDSIHLNAYGNDSFYKLYYDEQGRLSYSYWYLGGAPFRGWFLTYSDEPYHFPSPLDFNNYRFYTLTWGGFENSCPIYDKNYAPSSISYMQWNDWEESWYPINNSVYGVQVYDDEIALIDTQPGNYSAYFYYNDDGTYTHKHVNYYYGGSVEYTLNWEYGTPNDDPSGTPPVMSLIAFPNPFSQNLNIKLENAKAPTDISIYNIKGQLIRNWKDVRTDELTWDGKDNANKLVSSGIYLIKAKQGKSIFTIKVFRY